MDSLGRTQDDWGCTTQALSAGCCITSHGSVCPLARQAVGPRFRVGMLPEFTAALKPFAFHSGVPLAEYERRMVHDHILQRGAAPRERGAALRALINAGKAWIIAYSENAP